MLQYQGTDDTGASNDPNREARLGRMAMRNLVSDYPPPDSSSSNGAVNPDLSNLSTDGLQFTENRNMNQAKATPDVIRAGRGMSNPHETPSTPTRRCHAYYIIS